MKEVVIVSQARTAFGAFQGSLANTPAPKLGASAIQGALDKAGIKPEQVSEVIMGNVLQAGVGQAPARQAAMAAGIPQAVPAMTLNKVCGSGMKSLMLAAQSIQLGESDVVVAGGMENMSLAPYYLKNARSGLRMGDQKLVDGMIQDGLWDVYNDQHMGNCAELCAAERSFSRQEQDEYAKESFEWAQKAQKEGKFQSDIVPVTVRQKKDEVQITEDEGPSKVKFEKIPELKPVFQKDGSVTAANSSGINDGAAALVLMSADQAKERGLTPLARLVTQGTHAQAPEWFTTAPSGAMQKTMERAGWNAKDVDLFEVNEAFSVVALAAQKDLGISRQALNVWGGAIALGHPIGASGARIVLTLISALKDQGRQRGVAGICIGGGEATSVAVELL